MAANEITKSVFKKSFLKNIQSVYSYDSVIWTNELKTKIAEYLIEKGFETRDTGTVAMVQCSKNSIAIMVSEKGVVLSMDVKDYISFEHYLDIFSDIFGVFSIVGCREIKNFIFQKLNLYRIGPLKNGRLPSRPEVFRLLFSKEICDCTQVVPKVLPDYFYTMQPGFNELNDYVVAKLLISSMRVSPIKIENLTEELEQVNKEMNNLWYSAITDMVKDLMSK